MGTHRHADDRKGGLGRHHARQVCRAASAGDNDLQTVGTGIMRELTHQFRGAVREITCFMYGTSN